jgi:hypothetical protein
MRKYFYGFEKKMKDGNEKKMFLGLWLSHDVRSHHSLWQVMCWRFKSYPFWILNQEYLKIFEYIYNNILEYFMNFNDIFLK